MNVNKCLIQGKIKYPNLAQAEQAMFETYVRTGKEVFGSYKCPGCSSWHLTSMYDNRSLHCKNRFAKLKNPKKKESKKLTNAMLPQKEQQRAFAELQKIQTQRTYRIWYNLKRHVRQNARIVVWVVVVEVVIRLLW